MWLACMYLYLQSRSPHHQTNPQQPHTKPKSRRSIFPCQDAPAVKMTYAAKIRAPAWATALMSALRYVA